MCTRSMLGNQNFSTISTFLPVGVEHKAFEIKMPFEPSLRRYGVSLPPINIKQLYNSIMARGDS